MIDYEYVEDLGKLVSSSLAVDFNRPIKLRGVSIGVDSEYFIVVPRVERTTRKIISPSSRGRVWLKSNKRTLTKTLEKLAKKKIPCNLFGEYFLINQGFITTQDTRLFVYSPQIEIHGLTYCGEKGALALYATDELKGGLSILKENET
jgi:hypothetical protein